MINKPKPESIPRKHTIDKPNIYPDENIVIDINLDPKLNTHSISNIALYHIPTATKNWYTRDQLFNAIPFIEIEFTCGHLSIKKRATTLDLTLDILSSAFPIKRLTDNDKLSASAIAYYTSDMQVAVINDTSDSLQTISWAELESTSNKYSGNGSWYNYYTDEFRILPLYRGIKHYGPPVTPNLPEQYQKILSRLNLLYSGLDSKYQLLGKNCLEFNEGTKDTLQIPGILPIATTIVDWGYSCTKQKLLELPDSIITIQDYGVSNQNIEEFTAGTGLTLLGNGTFCGAKSLQKITLNDGLVHIGSECFSNIDLGPGSVLKIPSTAIHIQPKAFQLMTADILDMRDLHIYDLYGEQDLFRNSAFRILYAPPVKCLDITSFSYCDIQKLVVHPDTLELYIPDKTIEPASSITCIHEIQLPSAAVIDEPLKSILTKIGIKTTRVP